MSSNGCEFTIKAMCGDTCEFHGFASWREAISVWDVLVKRAWQSPEDLTVDLFDFSGRLIFSSLSSVVGDEPIENLRVPGIYAVEWFGKGVNEDYRLVPMPENRHSGLDGAVSS
jgi:hypothetical protein